MLRMLVTVRDMGAAINIAEIIRFAHCQPQCELKLYIQQPAASYFSYLDIPFVPGPALIAKTLECPNANSLKAYARKLIDEFKPDVILAGLSTPGDAGLDEALIHVAKGKIPSFVMQDFWGEVNDFFGSSADYYLCLDEEAKNLTEKSFPTKGLVIGSPRHSCYKDFDILSMRSELRRELNLSATQVVIGLFGQALHHLEGYQETIKEFLEGLTAVNPNAVILYRKHPRESLEQAAWTKAYLEKFYKNYLLVTHKKVEQSLIVCNAVISILSNCLYDSSYLNYYSSEPLITPIALCYKKDILRHLQNYSMIENSPYKSKNLALICDYQPNLDDIKDFLSKDRCKHLWLASKNLENPNLAAAKAFENIEKQLFVKPAGYSNAI